MASIIALTKRLCGSKWLNAFEYFLDLENKCHGSEDAKEGFKDGSGALSLLAVDFRLRGQEQRAEKLEYLRKFLPEDSGIYLLLALCAQKPFSEYRQICSAFACKPTCSTDNSSITKPLLFQFQSNEAEYNPSCQVSKSEKFLFPVNWISHGAKKALERDLEEFDLKEGNFQAFEESLSEKVQDMKKEIEQPEQRSLFSEFPSTSYPLDPRCPESPVMDNYMNSDSNADDEALTVKDILHLLTCVPLNSGSSCSSNRFSSSCFVSSTVNTFDRFKSTCKVCATAHKGQFANATGSYCSEQEVTQFDEYKLLKKRAQLCGTLYRRLVEYSDSHSQSCGGRVLAASAAFVGKVAQNYLRNVLSEAESGRSSFLKVWEVLFVAERSKEDMEALCIALDAIESSDGSACAVIDILHDKTEDNRGRKVIEDLFLAAIVPYLEMIWDWSFCASSLRDFCGEFFASHLGRKATDSELLLWAADCVSDSKKTSQIGLVPKVFGMHSALLILRLGRSRALLEQVLPNHALLNLKPPVVNNPLVMESLRSISNDMMDLVNKFTCREREVRLYSPDNMYENEDSSCRFSRNDSRFSCISSGKSSDSSTALRKTPFVIPSDQSAMSTDHREYSSNTSSLFPLGDTRHCNNHESNSNSLEESSVRCSPHVVLEQYIIPGLQKAELVMQDDILRHFKYDIQIFDNLHALRKYALLGAGDFANVLVYQISQAAETSRKHELFINRRVTAARTFYGTSGRGGVAFRQRRHLEACLRAALAFTSNEESNLSDNISLIVRGGGDGSSNLWESNMQIRYRIGFPLNIIISKDTLELYSKCFNFFLKVRRAQACLRNLFMTTRRRSALKSYISSSRNSLRFQRVLTVTLWQFCWHAEHFVSIVGGYEFNQVHGVSWTEFELSWKSLRTVWELRDAHLRFLNDSVRRVLLGEKQKSIMGVISGALDIIFHVDLKMKVALGAGSYMPAVEETELLHLLRSSREALSRRSTFLIDVLEKLVQGGSHPHLEDFLTRLNFNYFYKNLPMIRSV